MPEVKRQTAYKCSVKMILDGNYIQKPGWDPNYIQINGLHISRINILAVAVGKEGNSLTIDDGTGQVRVVFFNEQNKLESINIGDVVIIIGRPREYDKKRFIVPEIIKVVEDKKWIEYRKLELSIQEKELRDKNADDNSLEFKPVSKKEFDERKEEVFAEESKKSEDESGEEEFNSGEKFEDNYASKIISAIKKLDKGDGANINDVISHSGLEQAEKYILSLINEGEIFELRPGRIKIL